MKLYGYWRSSAAYRVRIALNLKSLKPHHIPVSLVNNGGENFHADYLAKNPAAKLPTLETGGFNLTQSLAIIEYLDEVFPMPPLVPGEPPRKALIRAFAQTIAADTHPLQNSRVLTYLRDRGGFDDGAVKAWIHEWMTASFGALEESVARRNEGTPFAFGHAPTLADVCLVPQMYNARRFEVDLSPFPRLVAMDAAARALPAFEAASPENQADAPKHA